ncbi:hypothetical protein MTO96_018401 [Rhipicephalus appendiculatus]
MAFSWLVLTLVMAAATGGIRATHEYEDYELSEESALGKSGSCIHVGLPNVMGLEKCLGNSLNLCQAEHTVHTGLMKIATCSAASIFKNLTPKPALAIMRPILVIFANHLSGDLGTALNDFMKAFKSTGSLSDPLCHGEIKVGIHSKYGKCFNSTLEACKIGSKIDISFVKTLVQVNTCFIEQTLHKSPKEIVKDIFCTLLRTAKPLFKNLQEIGGLTVYNAAYNALCK